jgi:hypothetical protein
MKIQEINSMAKRLGIKPFGKTKTNLIREIQRAEGNFDCFGTATHYCDQLLCCFRSLCLKSDTSPKSRK